MSGRHVPVPLSDAARRFHAHARQVEAASVCVCLISARLKFTDAGVDVHVSITSCSFFDSEFKFHY